MKGQQQLVEMQFGKRHTKGQMNNTPIRQRAIIKKNGIPLNKENKNIGNGSIFEPISHYQHSEIQDQDSSLILDNSKDRCQTNNSQRSKSSYRTSPVNSTSPNTVKTLKSVNRKKHEDEYLDRANDTLRKNIEYEQSKTKFVLKNSFKDINGKITNFFQSEKEAYSEEEQDCGTYCENHPQKIADFSIRFDQDTLNYCSKCAASLASQGFKVQRVNLTASSPKPRDSFHKRSFNLRTQVHPSNRRQHQIYSFLDELQQVASKYSDLHCKLNQIEQEKANNQNKTILTAFYDTLIDIVQAQKQVHLQAIQESDCIEQDLQQIGLEREEVQTALQEINAMQDDVSSNIDKIMTEVDEESYIECMQYYNDNTNHFRDRAQELGHQIEGQTREEVFKEEDWEEKVSEFKKALAQIVECQE